MESFDVEINTLVVALMCDDVPHPVPEPIFSTAGT